MSILNEISDLIEVWADPDPQPTYPPVFMDTAFGSLLWTRKGQNVYVDIVVDTPGPQATGDVPWPEQAFLEVDTTPNGYFTIYNGEWTVNPSTVPNQWVAAYTTSAPADPAPEPGPGVAAYIGYAPTGAKLPYYVSRPLDIDASENLALSGDATGWATQISIYCCAASVEASFNLALAVIGTLQGARAGGTTLSASMGYNGALVEGHYESQVTVQLSQGGI